MAKTKKTKTTTTRTTSSKTYTNNDIIKFCAFWGMAIAAILFVVGGIMSWAGVGLSLVSIFNLLAQIALAVAIALPAYNYVRGKKKGWKIFYWIALVIYVFGVVFGIIHIWVG